MDQLRDIVAGLEQPGLKSAAQVRRAVYARLNAFGLDVAALVKEARASRAQGPDAPALPPVWSTAPTRERVRRAGEPPAEVTIIPGGGGVPPLLAHRFEWPVAKLGLAIDEISAAERVRRAYLGRHGHAATGDYGTRAGSSDPTSRLGLTPAQERSAREWRAFWYRLNPALRAIVLNFVCEAPARGKDRPLTLDEFGKLYGRTTDPRRARGVAEGAIRTAVAVLAQLSREYDQWRAAERRAEVEAEEQNSRRVNNMAKAKLVNREGRWSIEIAKETT